MKYELHQGDSRDVIASMADASVDSVVTDPPYALVSVLQRFGNSPRSERTENTNNPYGRTGRGFMGQRWDTGDTAFDPSFWVNVLRVMKPGAHLVAFGGTRTYHRLAVAIEDAGFEIRDQIGWLYGSGFPKSHNIGSGWGTALKPAWEPIVLARKPLTGTVAANVLAHGTGAVNIEGCRVPSEGGAHREGEASQERRYTKRGSTNFAAKPGPRGGDPSGRWPANIIHDGSEEVVAAFPNDAARFFYCAKASRKDRDEGYEDLPKKPLNWSSGEANPGSFQSEGTDKTARNHHPTVKPTELMRYLCRLITPPGGVVLDPFMGSGSTGKAALKEGFRFIGIEREVEYIEIARKRLSALATDTQSTEGGDRHGEEGQRRPQVLTASDDSGVFG